VTTEHEIEVIENGILTTKTTTEEHQEWIVSQPLIPGLIYDEVIEYKDEGRITYENGKIIKYEDSEAKAAEDKRAKAEATAAAEKRKKEIITTLGTLKSERDGLELIGEDITAVEQQIEALQKEYREITA
jgi:hypothetical protein